MDRQIERLKKRITKKAKRGFRGFPVGTLSCYGPDDRRASKLVAAIIEHEGGDATEMRKWFSEQDDVRDDPLIIQEVTDFLEQFDARTVVMPETIIGCPHEEGIDYQEDVCPECPFWANRDRWTGDLTH
jgi:hypothetical protein